MVNDINHLKKQIEDKRQQMIPHANQNGLNSKVVIKYSSELDGLLNRLRKLERTT